MEVAEQEKSKTRKEKYLENSKIIWDDSDDIGQTWLVDYTESFRL